MSESMRDAVSDRLDRLERENRRLRRAGIVLLMGIGAAVLMGQATPNLPIIRATQIEAARFVLSSPQRRVLGEMEITRDGTPMLFLDHTAGGKGPPAFLVAVKDNEMSLNLFAKRSKHQVAIAADKVILKGNEGKTRMILLPEEKGIPLLALTDKDENRRVMLFVAPSGVPFLAFRTKEGKIFWSAA